LGDAIAGEPDNSDAIGCGADSGDAIAVLGRGGARIGSPKIGPLGGGAPAESPQDASGVGVCRANPLASNVLSPARGLSAGGKTERGELVEASATGVMSAGCRGEAPDDAGAGLAAAGEFAGVANAESRKESNRS
jgi:hypothetical protein